MCHACKVECMGVMGLYEFTECIVCIPVFGRSCSIVSLLSTVTPIKKKTYNEFLNVWLSWLSLNYNFILVFLEFISIL